MPGQVVPDNRHRDVEIVPLTAELRTPFAASGVGYQIRVYAANAGAVVHQIQNLTAGFYDVPRQANGANMQFDANSPSDVFDFSFDFVDSAKGLSNLFPKGANYLLTTSLMAQQFL